MAFRMTRTLTLSANDALDRITAAAGVWRESELPPEVLAARVYGATVWRKQRRFGLRLDATYDEARPELVGEVAPLPSGGSVVRARVGYAAPRYGLGVWVLGGFALWCLVWAEAVGMGVLLGALAAGSYALERGSDRAVTYEGDAFARLLADRLDGAIAADLVKPQPGRDVA
jgi:hypothetical protein